MAVAPLSVAEMTVVVRDVLDMKEKRQQLEDETCRSFFGAPVVVIATLWNRLIPLIDMSGSKPKHLLWALVFLKVYSTTMVHCRIVGWPDAKTFRKWSWYFVELIAALKPDVIVLDRRFDNFNGTQHCLMSIDGIDCMINEPWPFEKKWYSKSLTGQE